MLKFVVPKGSLEEQTLRLLEQADLRVRRGSSRDYHGRIDDERIERVSLLRPQEIPRYVEEGFFDLGITGRDWVEETDATVDVLASLEYAKGGVGFGVKIVLAVPQSDPAEQAADLPNGTRISTEYPNLVRRYFERLGTEVRVFESYGATEAKVPEIVDATVDVSETGGTLRAHGMKIIETLLESEVLLIANPVAAVDAEKRRAMDDVTTLLLGALRAGRFGPGARRRGALPPPSGAPARRTPAARRGPGGRRGRVDPGGARRHPPHSGARTPGEAT